MKSSVRYPVGGVAFGGVWAKVVTTRLLKQ